MVKERKSQDFRGNDELRNVSASTAIDSKTKSILPVQPNFLDIITKKSQAATDEDEFRYFTIQKRPSLPENKKSVAEKKEKKKIDLTDLFEDI